MNYFDLKTQFAQSLTLRLLRAENVPLVTSVLFAGFKRDHRPTVPESRLRAILESQLEELRESEQLSGTKPVREYLAEWSDMQHGYLRRFIPPDSDEPHYELTPEAERAFQCLEMLRPRPHVGTESKFRALVAVLAELVDNSTPEPERRLRNLRDEQERIQQQIEEIERTGVVAVYNATQLNERFTEVLRIARELLGDFREVERHFRRVTENIAVRQSEPGATRGGIVGQTLDAQDQLRGSSQGQSFYAFWEFLLAAERRSEFADLVHQVYELSELDNELRSDSLLLSLQRHLRAEGIKVLQSNERLVSQLRRLLDIRASAERKEVGRLLQDIKQLAHRARDLPANTSILETDGLIDFSSLMSKVPWTAPKSIGFGGDLEVDTTNSDDVSDAWDSFLGMEPIDFDRLRANIADCLEHRVQISLPELLTLFPPRNGIIEVLAYLVIAESDGPHVIFEEAFEILRLAQERGRMYRVPQVVFSHL